MTYWVASLGLIIPFPPPATWLARNQTDASVAHVWNPTSAAERLWSNFTLKDETQTNHPSSPVQINKILFLIAEIRNLFASKVRDVEQALSKNQSRYSSEGLIECEKPSAGQNGA